MGVLEPFSDEDLAALRDRAEYLCVFRLPPLMSADPKDLLRLLNRLAKAEAVCEAASRAHRSMMSPALQAWREAK